MIGYDEAYGKQVVIEGLNKTGLLQYLLLYPRPLFTPFLFIIYFIYVAMRCLSSWDRRTSST